MLVVLLAVVVLRPRLCLRLRPMLLVLVVVLLLMLVLPLMLLLLHRMLQARAAVADQRRDRGELVCHACRGRDCECPSLRAALSCRTLPLDSSRSPGRQLVREDDVGAAPCEKKRQSVQGHGRRCDTSRGVFQARPLPPLKPQCDRQGEGTLLPGACVGSGGQGSPLLPPPGL